MSKQEIQVQINIIEENESGELVITIDKKPEQYKDIFFYKGVPADQSDLWKRLAGEPPMGKKVNPVIRFNILRDNKKVNFTGKVIVYYPKVLLHSSSDKDKKALLAQGKIIDGFKEGSCLKLFAMSIELSLLLLLTMIISGEIKCSKHD